MWIPVKTRESRDKRYGVGDLVDFRLKIQDRVQDFIYGDALIPCIGSGQMEMETKADREQE